MPNTVASRCCNSSENIHLNYKKVYEKRYFLLEKSVYTDIENSENKTPIRNFRLCCSKAFLYQVG